MSLMHMLISSAGLSIIGLEAIKLGKIMKNFKMIAAYHISLMNTSKYMIEI